jgi:tRNA pseudouridine38-40 synthase
LKTLLLKIEYDGTGYRGWQVQPGVPTVQGELQRVFQQICQSDVRLQATSRTDAGVHALGQVALVRVSETIALKKLFFSVNALLPVDIAVVDMVRVADDFDPRKANTGKHYYYRILNAPVDSALDHRYSAWVRQPLDIEKIAKACRLFVGKHDFAAFRGKGCQQLQTIKTMSGVDCRAEPIQSGLKIRLFFEGSGFLKNMIRIMAGILIEIGRGRVEEQVIAQVLASGVRHHACKTAPARGLVLEKVCFLPDPFMDRSGETWDQADGCPMA